MLDGIDEKTAKQRKHLAIVRAKRYYNSFSHRSPASGTTTEVALDAFSNQVVSGKTLIRYFFLNEI